jgi:hypothetical protein
MKHKNEDKTNNCRNNGERIPESRQEDTINMISELQQKESEREIELDNICKERDSLLELYLDDSIGKEDYSYRLLEMDDREFEIQMEIRKNKEILDSLQL